VTKIITRNADAGCGDLNFVQVVGRGRTRARTRGRAARRAGGLVAVALGVVAALTACDQAVAGFPLAEGRVPAGLAAFYSQNLDWGSCAVGYATDEESRQAFEQPGEQCARLTVPLDYAHPNGPTASIGLLRIGAEDPFHRIGSLVINPGGPGDSGMVAAAGLAEQILGTQLARHFDLIGFDPRGVGASLPLIHCLTDAQRDAERLEVPLDDPKQEAARTEGDNKRYAQACARNSGDAVLANVGTRDVAKDLDVLRAALNEPKLTYLGWSYGTKIGTQYAEDFPQNVRAMVLDGAVDPDESANQSGQGQGDGFAQAFGDFADWCARQSRCGVGTEPDQADQALEALSAPLKKKAVRVGDRQLSYSDVQTAVTAALYSRQDWSRLNNGLLDLAAGNGKLLLALADAYLQRGPDGRYSNNQDAFTAIRCADYPPVTDRAKLLQEEQDYDRSVGLNPQDDPYVPVLDTCAFWPVPNTSAPHLPQVTGLPPVLVVSTTHDPATPYQSGVNLAHDLGGQLLTFDGTQHTAFLDGNSCVDRWGSDYLLDLTPVPDGTTCH
jgi:pimeloyl-ACP methyl ester carboxylesterase